MGKVVGSVRWMRKNGGKLAPGSPAGAPVEPPQMVKEDPLALDEWERLAAGLVVLGILTEQSAGLFALYVQALADVRRARAAIAAAGNDAAALKEHNKGGTRRSADYNIARERGQDALRIAAELGLGPIAKQRLAGIERPDEGDPKLRALLYPNCRK